MAKDKKSFLLYCDLIHTVEHLTLEERGQVFTWLLQYVNDLNPEPLPGLLSAVVEPIKQQLKRDLKKYEKRAERARENGKKGGRPKTQKTQSVILEPRKPDTDTVTDKDIVINKFIKWANDSELDEKKVLDQLDKAWFYYEERDWYNSKGKKVVNKVTTIRNNWFKVLDDYKLEKKRKPIMSFDDLTDEDRAKLARGENL